MNGRIVFFTLISTFLLLALVVAVSAQTRTVGVSVGNKFRYDNTIIWSSNDTSATPPSILVDANNTQWKERTVTAISGTNITGQMTTHCKNGTEITVGGWVDVDTGDSLNIALVFISANLSAGDSIGTNASITTWIINETVSRTYLNGVRDTNHVNITSSSSDGTHTYRTNVHAYWDKATGVLVESLYENINQTGAYTTIGSSGQRIISSDLWIVPEFPTWTPALLMLIVLTSATMVIARQKQPKRPPPLNPPSFYSLRSCVRALSECE
jgi:hypothetical protein